MSGSVNKVIIVGNLGKDPEVRTFQNGDKVVSFSVATSENWKDKQTGERKQRAEWHNVSVLNKGLINVCENYLRKGSKVYIEGQLETRKWQDQSGNDRYSTEIVANEMQMLGGRSGGGAPMDSSGASQGQSQAPSQSRPAPADTAPMDDGFDDIPF